MRLYVGGQAWTVQGERDDLDGYRCWSASNACQAVPSNPERTRCLLDSGAFSDAPEDRLTPEAALARQLSWEAKARQRWASPFWQAEAVVSYDRLIDETWVAGTRHKRRWSLRDAESAVEETVTAAHYLASQRQRLHPRSLVLACQGVECGQYADCARAILARAEPGDWFGLGGWCILGRHTTLLPEFARTIAAVVPLVAAAGLGRVHLFGVLYRPALGMLLWLCDRHGIEASCDSAAPVLACTRGNARKAGQRQSYWRDNVRWWQRELASLRSTEYYRQPPRELFQ
jgi:hypothetical protein